MYWPAGAYKIRAFHLSVLSQPDLKYQPVRILSRSYFGDHKENDIQKDSKHDTKYDFFIFLSLSNLP